MAADINDKLRGVRSGGYPQPTTVSSSRSPAGTSLSCVALTNWFTDTAVDLITYKKNTDGTINQDTLAGWKGIVSGTTINTLTLMFGTDEGNDVGDFVEAAPTDAWGQGVYDFGTTLHTPDGNLKAKIVALGKINGGSTAGALLTDASGNVTAGPVTDEKWVNNVAFRANVNATQNTGNATFADMTFATEQYDRGSNFASSQFTAPYNGIYHFAGACGTNSNSTRLIMSLFDSSNNELIRGPESTSSSNVASTGAGFSGDIELTAGTVVKCRTFGNTTLTLTTDTARNWFCGHLVTRV